MLKSQGWRYNKKGFEEVFLPLSDTCNDPNGKTMKQRDQIKKSSASTINLDMDGRVLINNKLIKSQMPGLPL